MWNTLEGSPFVPENLRSNRVFHLQLNRLIRKYEKRVFNFAIFFVLNFVCVLKESESFQISR